MRATVGEQRAPSRDGAHCNDGSDWEKAGRAQGSHQLAVVSHDVILHPRGGLELLPAVLTGERLLPKDRGEPSHTCHSLTSTCFSRRTAGRSPVCSSPCASSAPPPSFCSHFYIWDRGPCLWPRSAGANAPLGSLVDGNKDKKEKK